MSKGTLGRLTGRIHERLLILKLSYQKNVTVVGKVRTRGKPLIIKKNSSKIILKIMLP